MAAIKHFAQINGTSALKDGSSYSSSKAQQVVSVPRFRVAPSNEDQQSSARSFGRSLCDTCIDGIMNTDIVRDLRYGTARGLMPRNATPTWKVVSACTVYGAIAVLAIVIGI